MHSVDKLAEMRTKFHVIQVKLIMSIWCFTGQCCLWSADHRTSVMTKYEAGLMLDVTNQLEILHTAHHTSFHHPIMCQPSSALLLPSHYRLLISKLLLMILLLSPFLYHENIGNIMLHVADWQVELEMKSWLA